MLGGGCPIQHSFAAQQCSKPTPIHGRLSSQHQSTVVHMPLNTISLIQPMNQRVIATYKKYYLHHTFRQAVKVSDESGTALQQFWKDYNIYNAIKSLTFLGMRLRPSP